MKNEVLTNFEDTTKAFIEALRSFDNDTINKIPFTGSWTAAQVTDHVLRSQEGFPRLVSAKTESTGRKPEEKAEIIKKIFLDFSTKMQSPDFILPSMETHDKEQLIKKVEDISRSIIEAMQTHDLSKECLSFPLPNMGTLTGLEWGWFAIYHTQRHIHQIKNIHASLVDL